VQELADVEPHFAKDRTVFAVVELEAGVVLFNETDLFAQMLKVALAVLVSVT
jgi:hypothetical protein